MVNLLYHRPKQRVEELWMLVEVEAHGPVVQLRVRNFLHDCHESVMSPRRRGVQHHCLCRLVEFVVLTVQEYRLRPVERAFARPDEFGNVQLIGVCLAEVLQPIRLMLRVQDPQLCVHSHVGPLTSEAGVQEGNQLLDVSVPLVLLDEFFEMVRVHDHVHACHLSVSELLCSDARRVQLLPDLRVVGLLRRVQSRLELSQVNEARREFGVVRDRLEKDLCSLVVPFLEEPVPHSLHVGSVGPRYKLLHFC
mmetsp:Transcript_35624/g.70203  ORF Transcript_35624/g.70203 Transcript_35624/m.70203 type:complete len:250 (-) Transcript_35624:1915-2664(-)